MVSTEPVYDSETADQLEVYYLRFALLEQKCNCHKTPQINNMKIATLK